MGEDLLVGLNTPSTFQHRSKTQDWLMDMAADGYTFLQHDDSSTLIHQLYLNISHV